MELYGGSASIAQANALSQQAQQLNQANADFNRTLAESLDEANREQDQDRSAKLQKNLLSGGTSAGKLAIIAKRGGIKRAGILGNLLVGGYTESPLSREEVLSREVGAERAPLTNPPQAGEAVAQRPVGTVETYTGEGRLAEQEAARASEVAGSTGLKTTAKVVEEVTGKAAQLGKIGVAGLGGAIDVYQDVGRLVSGKVGWDAFGSNTGSRIGNIANIVGSGLELAGVASGGVTPWALALEGVGATVGLIGSITEGIGEEVSGAKSKIEEQMDILKEQRGQEVAQQITQAVSRTQ